MTQAVARAGETFGQSVVEAIPPCVGIAVEYALRIAAKLAALVASGDNLMKLVQGGMAVVDLIRTALSGISQQSVSVDASADAATDPGAGQRGGEPASTLGAAGAAGSSGPSAGGLGGVSPSIGVSTVDGVGATQSSAAVPLSAPAGGGGVSTSATPSGAVPGLAPGARVGAGRGADTVRQGRQSARVAGSGGGAPGAVPLGAMGRPAGETDKEHQRKYRVVEGHEEAFEVAPQVITSYVKGNNR